MTVARQLALVLVVVAVGAGAAVAADPGNVVRALRVGGDVAIEFAASPFASHEVRRDVSKFTIGMTPVAGGVPAPTWTDAGAIDSAAGLLLLYDLAGEACEVCAGYAPPVALGNVGEPLLVEASGIEVSADHPGVLYLHNDSGDGARFFAISSAGAPLGEFNLIGATAVDWEDLSLGPCPTGSCVYLGDIGDNAAARTDYSIVRVTEPVVEVGSPVGRVAVGYERFPFAYPDGSHDAETLMVQPTTGDVYIITKRGFGEPSSAYKMPAPLVADVPVTLTKVADMPLPGPSDLPITGGDIHPCADRLLLRTYLLTYELTIAPGDPFEALFRTPTITSVPYALEPQGEAIAWTADGLGYVTVSEGSAPPLWFIGCR